MSTPDTPEIKAAREALAAYDSWLHGSGSCRFDTLPTHLRNALAEADKMRQWVERAAADENANAADLAALRIEHELHKVLLTAARRGRDEARAEAERLRLVLATTVRTLRDPRLPISEGVADGIIAGIEGAMADLAAGVKS